ncbi:MAG: uracil-DNA glycosylase [Chloroflexi bacterium RBG_13_57_8]|nr:MAG: uracil-DNA glycosylase [Chloroflexi bacterium RBG_13_57_8]
MFSLKKKVELKVSERIQCSDFPCADTEKNSYVVPPAEIDPAKVKIVMITEAPPGDKVDYYYASGNPFYLQTTLQAFKDAGAKVDSMQDILDRGVYITTAIKCAKTQYAVAPETMKNCAGLLEREIALFTNVKAFILGGDVAIKMMNDIWKRQTGRKVIPAGSTYKIRGQAYYAGDKRVLPSYTPAGKNFLIEKSKRKMVAEDIREALKCIY